MSFHETTLFPLKVCDAGRMLELSIGQESLPSRARILANAADLIDDELLDLPGGNGLGRARGPAFFLSPRRCNICSVCRLSIECDGTMAQPQGAQRSNPLSRAPNLLRTKDHRYGRCAGEEIERVARFRE